MTKPVPYTFVRGAYYYFTRRVPADLRQHYNYPRIVQGLRTSSPQEAKLQAKIEAAKLDAYWMQMRLAKSEVLGLSLIRDGMGVPAVKSSNVPSDRSLEGPTLLDALNVYLEQKGNGKAKSFRQSAERACGYVIENCGNKPLAAYTRQDALVFRDWLVARGLTGSSVTRNFSYVKAVINFALSEFALEIRNPFVGVYHDRSKGVGTRKPIPLDALRRVQSECVQIDDDIRWLVSLVSDTGMRMAEAAGLSVTDFNLQGDIPFVEVRKHPWRSLKTSASARVIPLSGMALWAAQRILQQADASPYAFPRYNRGSRTSANSASAAINKWLKNYVPTGCTMHSFRHSMRDRLRAVQCPSDVADQIGGWATDGVGQGYGSGYPIEVLMEWVKKW
ncbi:MAG: integrase [Rhodobacteraceae bacterium]|nr:integrase [Paracoccaceae bacterium]